MKKDINNIHDKSYKTLFSNKEIFLNLLNDFTENQWKQGLNPENLLLVDKSYVLSDYEELEADIVYRGTLEGREVIFYVLLEFQSSIDYSMPIRLLFYMIEIWRDVLKDIKVDEIKKKDFKLPAIMPIVTYNGADAWRVPKQFSNKIDASELFGQTLLDFEYMLIDVNRYEKTELIKKQSISSAIFLLDQKIEVKEYLERITTIARAFNKLSQKEKLELKNWIRNTVQEEIATQAMEILETDKEAETMVANITRTIEEMKEQAIEQGLEQGLEQGIKQGIQQEKRQLAKALLDVLDDTTIALKTGLSLEEVQGIRKAASH